MPFKKYSDYILEYQTQPELVKKEAEEEAEDDSTCPRCGATAGQCECQSKDYASTVNLNRMNKGKVKKPENKFKSDE